MSQPDPMLAAASDTARKVTTLAAVAAAIARLIIEILQERTRHETAGPARAGRLAGPDQSATSTAARTSGPGRPASVHDQVFASLPEQMARAVTTSPRFAEVATLLRDAEQQGIDVPALLGALAPAVARHQSDAVSTPSTAPASMPALTDRPGLKDRIRGALVRRRGDETPEPSAAWMSPDDQAWAVAVATYACGIEAAERLVTSQHWPQIAQDLATIGYGQQYGLTDLAPAQVLEQAWRAMPSSVGVDWPTAATMSLARARDQFRHAEPPRPEAAQSRTAPTEQTAQTAPTEQTAQAEQTPQPARSAASRRAAAAASRSTSVDADAQMELGDQAAPARREAAGQTRTRARTR